jgi:hypothetical protein
MARRHFEYFQAHPQLMLGLLAAAPGDHETRAAAESAHRAGAEELLRLLGLPLDPPPLLRTALRGCMGFLQQVTIEWLSHGQDVPVEQLAELCLDTVVSAVENAERHQSGGHGHAAHITEAS